MLQSIAKRFETSFLNRDIRIAGQFSLAAPTLVVFCLAAAVNAIGLSGGAFVFYPDSGSYVGPSYTLFERGSFSGVSLFRVPGYNIFLAPILGMFGKHAVLAMAAAQHLLVVLLAVIASQIGYELDRSSRWLGFLGGLLAAFSLQLQSYARLPMTEVLYTSFLMPGLLFTLRYLRTGAYRPFAMAALLFSIAVMVRPSGQFLPFLLMAVPAVQILLPGWRFLFPKDAGPDRRRSVNSILLGLLIYGVVVGPWLIRNYRVHDYFGISPTIGVNLYGNVVDYAGLIDETSPALVDIRRRWDEYEAALAAAGKPPTKDADWRSHMAAFGHYLMATGKPQKEIDAVFLQASLDAIKKHPWAYARLFTVGVYRAFVGIVTSVYYAPGVERGRPPPAYMPYALDPRVNEIPRESLSNIARRYLPPEDNPFLWREPTAATPLYGRLMTAYLAVNERRSIPVKPFLVGLGVVFYLVIRRRNIQWLAVILYLLYTAVVPFVVVPTSPRHRLPSDMITDLVIALAVVQAVLAFRWLLPHCERLLWRAGGRLAPPSVAAAGGWRRGAYAMIVLTGALVTAFLLLALAV